jgi:DNA-binding SARP family transcriptional activator/tetratricopeptide (TPR) repeat protein
MVDFRTLGSLELGPPDDPQVGAVLLHPKRAALLAWLAAATPRGFHRRDAILALLWPELDQERARASLRKAVHHIRRALGDDAIVGRGDEELRLGDAVRSDVRAFVDAAESGNAEAAMALYRGRFLEAFFVADAPEFEQWMEQERTRLHVRAFATACSLAEVYERKGDGFGAAAWGRRAAELAPHDEAAIRCLLELLDRLGDRAGALHAYHEFARRLASDYEVEPSAQTQALMESIRRRVAGKPTESSVPAEGPAPPAVPTVDPVPTVPAAQPIQPGRSKRRWAIGLGLALVAAMAAIVFRPRGPERAVSGQVVAVLPFAVRGDPSHQYLGDGMASLLAMGLDGAGELRSIDPQAVLSRAGAGGTTIDPQRADGIATSLGAGLFVLGDVVESGGRIRINAAIYRAGRTGRPLALTHAEGAGDSLFALVDQVAARMIAAARNDTARAVARLAGQTTHSLPALKAYLEGENDFRRGAFNRAQAGFQAAIALDSTFALAWYRLASAYSWGTNDSSRFAADQAVRYGARLAEPERQLLEPLRLYLRQEADSAEHRYREILARRPDEVDALFHLGEVLFHQNPPRGRAAAEARATFERAFAYNQGDAPVIHLLEIVALERDYVAFDSLLTHIKPQSHFWLTGRMVHAFVRGNEADRAAVAADVRTTRHAEAATVAGHAMYLVEDAGAASVVASLSDDPARPAEVRLVSRLLRGEIAMAAGRWRDAARTLDSAALIDPVRTRFHAALMHALPALPIPRSRLEEVRGDLARISANTAPRPFEILHTGDQGLHPLIHDYLIGLLDARLGRMGEARSIAAGLQRADIPGAMPMAGWYAEGVLGQVELLSGNSPAALAALGAGHHSRRSLDNIGYSPFMGLRHERFLRAEALLAVGRLDEAYAWFSSFSEHSPWGRLYEAPAQLRRAQIAERLGRKPDAVRHYTRFAALWKDADPEFQPMVADAGERLRHLSDLGSAR